jgi:hypothetical protein
LSSHEEIISCSRKNIFQQTISRQLTKFRWIDYSVSKSAA